MTDAGPSGAVRHPRPVVADYAAFLYEGFNRHELLVQRCEACARLRHPPAPFCPHCRSPDWTPFRAGHRGRIHSYTVHHHPPIPPFELPHPVVLADMDAGFRFLAAARGIPLDRLRIGMAVEIGFAEREPGYTLPVFLAAAGEADA